jgi:hypothetical protein
MNNTTTEINISKNTKIANCFLALGHLVIAIFYLIQQIVNIRNSLLIDDEIIRKITIDAMTYISIAISSILLIINVISGIGILRWKSWSWWLSASFFLFLAIQKVITFILGLYTKFFVLGIQEDTLFLGEFDFILNSLYISVIAIIILLFLNSNKIYINYKQDIFSKRRNFFICLGVAIAFIFMNILLSQISNFFSY